MERCTYVIIDVVSLSVNRLEAKVSLSLFKVYLFQSILIKGFDNWPEEISCLFHRWIKEVEVFLHKSHVVQGDVSAGTDGYRGVLN